MRKRLPNKLDGNERYEGYAVDFIHELSLLSNFKYEILVEEHGDNGQLRTFPNGTTYWDGMMGALLTHVGFNKLALCFLLSNSCNDMQIILLFLSLQEADLVIGDLTMSKDRAAAVEFTSPFMDLGEYSYHCVVKTTESNTKIPIYLIA